MFVYWTNKCKNKWHNVDKATRLYCIYICITVWARRVSTSTDINDSLHKIIFFLLVHSFIRSRPFCPMLTCLRSQSIVTCSVHSREKEKKGTQFIWMVFNAPNDQRHFWYTLTHSDIQNKIKIKWKEKQKDRISLIILIMIIVRFI